MTRAYRDPTADKAVRKITLEDKKYDLTIKIIKLICELAGYQLLSHIVLGERGRRK